MCLYILCYVCDIRYDYRIKWCSVHPYLQLFVEGFISYLCLLTHNGVQLLCFVFVLFVFVFYLVHHMLPVSLDCPFLIVPSVFSLCLFTNYRLLHNPGRYGKFHVMTYLSHHILLERVWKECINNDDQQFYQDKEIKSEQPPLWPRIIEHKNDQKHMPMA